MVCVEINGLCENNEIQKQERLMYIVGDKLTDNTAEVLTAV